MLQTPHRICNIHCSSTATMVVRALRYNYEHCLYCYSNNYKYYSLFPGMIVFIVSFLCVSVCNYLLNVAVLCNWLLGGFANAMMMMMMMMMMIIIIIIIIIIKGRIFIIRLLPACSCVFFVIAIHYYYSLSSLDSSLAGPH